MSESDLLKEISEHIKEARQTAVVGNYDASQVYYQGVLHEIQLMMQKPDDPKNQITKQNLMKYRKLLESEYEQVKEMCNVLVTFKNYAPAPAYRGGGAMGGMHDDFSNNQYEAPERDPDVWPPPPPFGGNKNRGGGPPQNYNSNPYGNYGGGGGGGAPAYNAPNQKYKRNDRNYNAAPNDKRGQGNNRMNNAKKPGERRSANNNNNNNATPGQGFGGPGNDQGFF